ncbi:EAL domain-containing protein [Oceanimonas sp. CHS3-5]|uniref:putative bifunctional diguanylate cyclase/phosphodiesterase n=1 Tax=Oceanimonas sp. CHS3-5 TaxID=3068186 RepID=UPI00273D5F98|nr:EAL domain-containing protein [Oceanimonas sp. CHS3-5]MDP5293321.1 EAL domain-containing protein [Oceanimonas sp. CHS3-5]
MRAQKHQDDSAGKVAGILDGHAREWHQLCEQAATEAGAERACFVFFHHEARGVSRVLGRRLRGWREFHYLAVWRQRGFYCALTAAEFQLDSESAFMAVPVTRGTQRGLMLLEFAATPVALTEHLRLRLDTLARHGALLWRETELDARQQQLNESSGRLLSRLKTLFMHVPILINGFNTQGRCILWNDECERVFGWHFDELKHHPAPIELFYPDPQERSGVIATFGELKGSEFREWHPVDRHGHRLTTLWANIMLPNGDMICVGHDITEQRALETQQRLAASVFEASYDGIMLTDADNRVVHINPSFTRITGYSPADMIDHPATLFEQDREGGEVPPLPADPDSPDQWQGECSIRRQNGSRCALLISVSVIRDERGLVQHHAIILTDISHIKRHEAELRQRALYDSLTRIPNRQLFSELLERGMGASQRGNNMLAVCYLDLDGFKQVNDNLGHAAGDRLLVEMGRRMSLVIRNCDVVARLGGDEFALMITGLHQPLECTDILDRVLAAIDTPVNLDGHQARVSASIGVAVFPQDASDGQTLLRYADKAMYEAKKQGKRRHVFFEPGLHSQDQERHQLYEELHRALANGEFLLHYQPKIDLFSRSMTGVEALLRWQHPQKGMLTPAEFLPAVLDSDMEFELGQWVVRRLLQQMTAWLETGQDYYASFNVSAGQLLHEDFYCNLKYLLGLYPAVLPERLELEFQESAVGGDVQRVAGVLERCQRLGLTISLDNFGAGYASLVHLNRLPVDIIKIDRRFITDLLTSPTDATMVEGVVQLATALSMVVVAEGMEVPELGERLQQLGCHYVQGYGISHPMPAEAIADWLLEWNRQLPLQ